MLNVLGQTNEPISYTADEVLAPYVWVFYVAFLVSFAFTPIMRKIALRFGIVDWPDLKRKAHVEPVAYLGGVAVYLGWAAAIGISTLLTIHSATGESGQTVQWSRFTSIFVGATIIVAVGVWDDVCGISPRVKLGGQILAAALLAGHEVGTRLAAGLVNAVANGMGFDVDLVVNPEDYFNPLYWLGAGLVVLFVLGGCNASNLLDGLDGLVSGVTAIVALGFTFIAVCLAMGFYGPGGGYSPDAFDPVRIVICLALVGAVLGFLPFNFNPATIFMGDAGSMLMGYLAASIMLLFAEKGDPQLVIAALIVFALPIMDALLAIVRRKLQRKPIFSPDSQHLHHQLIRSGLTVRQSVAVMYIMALVFAVLGCSMIFSRLRYVAAVFLVVFASVAVMAYKVGQAHSRRPRLDSAPEEGAESKDESAPPPDEPSAPDPPPSSPPAEPGPHEPHSES